MNYNVDRVVDATGLLCPEPVMLLHKIMREAAVGEIIKITATDPSTTRDIPKFCYFLKHELLDQTVDATTYIFYLRKSGL